VRHGISRLPEVEGDKPAKKKFKRYPIGYFHIDIAEVQTAEGKLCLFVAIDRTSKFAYVELHRRAAKLIAAAFLRQLITAVPHAIHTGLTEFKRSEIDPVDRFPRRTASSSKTASRTAPPWRTSSGAPAETTASSIAPPR
jgi:hypothetical protein